ncbi:RNA polymerase subunit sigma-70 [Nonomuraea indica]|uniref:RNA polymerase subunit sigma-70 n=1 Tax=Nonomuraea indica TaxID=1581193 RepID=UPI003182D46F
MSETRTPEEVPVEAAALEEHRTELTGYCYRMLGCGFEAEDAVQETLAKAWVARERYDPGRAPLRAWLYGIATHVCLDMLRGARRRARAMDLARASVPGADIGPPLPDHRWVQPVPDGLVLGGPALGGPALGGPVFGSPVPDGPALGGPVPGRPVLGGAAHGADPADVVVARESVRLAFVAALQHLPPRQRAVLILRDVLRWSAAEVAPLLGCSVAAVNSALQRARAALPVPVPASAPAEPDEGPDEELLARYVAAFERYDVETLVSLLREDATMSMPPFTWWLRGRADIRAVLLGSGAPCAGSRLVPAGRANGAAAFGQYLKGEPFALVVIETRRALVSAVTTHLGDRLFPMFGLPMSFAAPIRTDG